MKKLIKLIPISERTYKIQVKINDLCITSLENFDESDILCDLNLSPSELMELISSTDYIDIT